MSYIWFWFPVVFPSERFIIRKYSESRIQSSYPFAITPQIWIVFKKFDEFSIREHFISRCRTAPNKRPLIWLFALSGQSEPMKRTIDSSGTECFICIYWDMASILTNGWSKPCAAVFVLALYMWGTYRQRRVSSLDLVVRELAPVSMSGVLMIAVLSQTLSKRNNWFIWKIRSLLMWWPEAQYLFFGNRQECRSAIILLLFVIYAKCVTLTHRWAPIRFASLVAVKSLNRLMTDIWRQSVIDTEIKYSLIWLEIKKERH